tara:strand:+ start:1450 stop:2592 length:1143 start_codon:yes stop_codon:yes gene_type:complete
MRIMNMKLIAKLEEFYGRYKPASGCIPTKALKRMEVNDDYIVSEEFFTKMEKDCSTVAADAAHRWRLWCSFVRAVVALNPNYELFVKSLPDSSDYRVIYGTMYIGSKYVPNTFGAVRLRQKVGRNGKSSVSYEVYSPFIRNNRYNGGNLFFHNASIYSTKILGLINTRVRPPLAEERHLFEIEAVQDAQERGLAQRTYLSRDYASQVGNWDNREKVLVELVSLKEHLNHNAAGGDTGKMDTYVFMDKDLSIMLDTYMRELAELGDAVDKNLERSKCLQRVHIIKGEKSGKSFFSRTVIRNSTGTYRQRSHDVYGDTIDAAYAPIETMPEEVGEKIAMLNMLDKPMDGYGDYVWVLNTGTMVTKNELYYLPVDVDTLYIDT